MKYFERHHRKIATKRRAPATYLPGEIVAWDLGGGILHIGIVTDRKEGERPLILHNIGRGAREEDILFQYEIIGHYGTAPPPPSSPR